MGKWWGLYIHTNLFDPMHLAKRGHNFVTFWYRTPTKHFCLYWYILWELVHIFFCFCFKLRSMLHVFLLPWKYIVHVYRIWLHRLYEMSRRFNFDCFQNSNVCFTERYPQSAKRLISICANEDRDTVNLIVCLGFLREHWSEAMHQYWYERSNRRDTTKHLINRCPTFKNWISREGFGISSWLGDYRMWHTIESVNCPYENSRRNPPGIQADSKRKGHGFEKILA